MRPYISSWTVHTKFDGSVTEFVRQEGWTELLEHYPMPSFEAWTPIAVFGIFQAILQLCLPGTTVYGPVTPKGNTSVYKVQFHIIQHQLPANAPLG